MKHNRSYYFAVTLFLQLNSKRYFKREKPDDQEVKAYKTIPLQSVQFYFCN